jgi:glucosamine--fructose-6-phosphate aminotransferase (isomerizing)
LLAAAIAAGHARGTLSNDEEARLTQAMIELPSRANEALNLEEDYRYIAENVLAQARDVLFLGRGLSYPIALEGALKLKEISYIHAEGYAAGEMKHGPIALIDDAVPVVVVAPTDALFDKTASNFEQVKARGGKLVLLSDSAGTARSGTDPLCHPPAAAGLLHGNRQGHRRRPTAQPRQERDRRIADRLF